MLQLRNLLVRPQSRLSEKRLRARLLLRSDVFERRFANGAEQMLERFPHGGYRLRRLLVLEQVLQSLEKPGGGDVQNSVQAVDLLWAEVRFGQRESVDFEFDQCLFVGLCSRAAAQVVTKPRFDLLERRGGASCRLFGPLLQLPQRAFH